MESIIPIRLAPGNVVRIVRGRGARLTARRGALWISEEGSLDDHVLMPGDSLTLELASSGNVAYSDIRSFN